MNISRKNFLYRVAYNRFVQKNEASTLFEFIGDFSRGFFYWGVGCIFFVLILFCGYTYNNKTQKSTPVFSEKQKWYFLPLIYGVVWIYFFSNLVWNYGIMADSVYYQTHKFQTVFVFGTIVLIVAAILGVLKFVFEIYIPFGLLELKTYDFFRSVNEKVKFK